MDSTVHLSARQKEHIAAQHLCCGFLSRALCQALARFLEDPDRIQPRAKLDSVV